MLRYATLRYAALSRSPRLPRVIISVLILRARGRIIWMMSLHSIYTINALLMIHCALDAGCDCIVAFDLWSTVQRVA